MQPFKGRQDIIRRFTRSCSRIKPYIEAFLDVKVDCAIKELDLDMFTSNQSTCPNDQNALIAMKSAACNYNDGIIGLNIYSLDWLTDDIYDYAACHEMLHHVFFTEFFQNLRSDDRSTDANILSEGFSEYCCQHIFRDWLKSDWVMEKVRAKQSKIRFHNLGRADESDYVFYMSIDKHAAGYRFFCDHLGTDAKTREVINLISRDTFHREWTRKVMVYFHTLDKMQEGIFTGSQIELLPALEKIYRSQGTLETHNVPDKPIAWFEYADEYERQIELTKVLIGSVPVRIHFEEGLRYG